MVSLDRDELQRLKELKLPAVTKSISFEYAAVLGGVLENIYKIFRIKKTHNFSTRRQIEGELNKRAELDCGRRFAQTKPLFFGRAVRENQ